MFLYLLGWALPTKRATLFYPVTVRTIIGDYRSDVPSPYRSLVYLIGRIQPNIYFWSSKQPPKVMPQRTETIRSSVTFTYREDKELSSQPQGSLQKQEDNLCLLWSSYSPIKRYYQRSLPSFPSCDDILTAAAPATMSVSTRKIPTISNNSFHFIRSAP